MEHYLRPDWPAPQHIHAYTTTRAGGISAAPYAALNLATHVGDQASAVAANRQRLQQQLQLPQAPCWLNQTHSTTVVNAADCTTVVDADASFTHQSNVVCAVLTADCLPLLLTDTAGRFVAAVHAGWRGLAAGIIEQTIAAIAASPETILVWLGPAISQAQFEVGSEVREQFVQHDPSASKAFIAAQRPQHFLADLYTLARQRLHACGITHIYGGEYCTYSDSDRYYSYRRDGITGRMASLIWRGEA